MRRKLFIIGGIVAGAGVITGIYFYSEKQRKAKEQLALQQLSYVPDVLPGEDPTKKPTTNLSNMIAIKAPVGITKQRSGYSNFAGGKELCVMSTWQEDVKGDFSNTQCI